MIICKCCTFKIIPIQIVHGTQTKQTFKQANNQKLEFWLIRVPTMFITSFLNLETS